MNPKGDVALVKIYAPNLGASERVKQLLADIKGDTTRSTVTVGTFNTLLAALSRSSRQKINRDTVAISDALDQWTSPVSLLP